MTHWHALCWRSRARRSFAALLAVSSVIGDTQGQCELAGLTSPNGETDNDFGRSVSVAGNVAVVGDPGNFPGVGAAYVFRYDGSMWIEDATLAAPEPDLFDAFGSSVALSPDIIVVGAPTEDAPELESGAAYIFRYDPITSGWAFETTLTASDGASGDHFGLSVSIDKEIVLVGARDDQNDGLLQSGSAYVFRFDGSTWVEEAKLTASEPAAGELFGNAVSNRGNVALVGAPSRESAFVFRYNGLGWLQDAELTAFDAAPDDRFGFAVTTNGSISIVGAPHDDRQTGAAYVFRYDSAAWIFETKLVAAEPIGSFPLLGRSLSISPDAEVVLIGAPNDSALGAQSGAAHLFRNDIAGWQEVVKLTASNGGASDKFGTSVSLGDAMGLVGATGGGGGAGTGYVFGALSGTDCNDNSVTDECDIVGGTSQDLDGNGIPDECECLTDVNSDGVVNILDLIELLLCFGQPATPPCDAPDTNQDGVVNVLDLIELLLDFGMICA